MKTFVENDGDHDAPMPLAEQAIADFADNIIDIFLAAWREPLLEFEMMPEPVKDKQAALYDLSR